MSHFAVMVIGDDIDSQLEAYDENLEVEPRCLGEVSDSTKNQMMDFYKKKGYNFKTFDECYEAKGEDWDGGILKKNEDGVWCEYSTYNPDSKWDWYSVGGRWGGFLHYKDADPGFVETNEAYIHELDMDYLLEHVPFCFVTEDGEWREKGEMGWWCSVSNEKPEDSWKQQFIDYVKSLDESCLVTVVDFHI